MDILQIIAIFYAIFLLILIPIYWKNYGIANFLWFSDIALFMTFLAIVFKSPLLISMVAVGILPLEIIWSVDYFYQLAKRKPLLGISDYMFDSNYSLTLRALSLFHLAIPLLVLWLLFAWGYEPQAIIYQTILFWLVDIIVYCFTKPKENINWVFVPTFHCWKSPSPFIWLISILIAVPIAIFLPMHYLWLYVAS